MSPECVIGVDLGGTKLLAGVVDADLNVHHRVHRAVHGLGQRELLDMAVEAVEEARAATTSEVAAVGFGIPCLIDQRRGMATMAVNLPLRDVPFRDLMAERLGLPVEVDNDANVAAIAEWRAGAAQGMTNAVVLTIGTGIGGGLILNGAPYRGSIGAGAELGHITIDLDGPPCQGHCPNNGCLETLASGTALAREGKRIAGEQPDSALGRAHADGREITGALITELAHDGDAASIEALTLIGTNLGIGIASYLNIFNPDIVVIGGGVIAAGELLLAPARAEAVRRALPTMSAHAQIVPAQFGTEAGLVGAAALALDGAQRSVA
ncbi:MAG TPA: ROK family protein [Conexibacter sp.]|nr:ROK family protein [Conexibacter sp.]